MKKSINLVTSAFVLYHVLAIIADAEQVMVNLRRARAQPSPRNLVRLLSAEGVLIRDLGAL